MEIKGALRHSVDEVTMLRLAREVVKDIHDLDTILANFHLDYDTWRSLTENPAFVELIRSEKAAWSSASNTEERAKLKALSFFEEALPEFYERAHDSREPLAAKVKLLEVIARTAGIYTERASTGGPIDGGIKVTINLGSDNKLTFEKDITQQVIDHDEEY